ncbi:CHAT domain-containing protein [Actinoallomurus sp. CA-142502]|uniref:CHAT domain-containing protein n=1 Tax=Actinoallomurus sp. CA-142502 TaxID=3239885 RepID=UPI003D8BA4CF
MWWIVVALFYGSVALIFGFAGDRHISNTVRRSGLFGVMTGLMTVIQHPMPHPWAKQVALSMVLVGLFASVVRRGRIRARQRVHPPLDPAAAFEANESGLLSLRRFDLTGTVETLNDSVEKLRLAVQASVGERVRIEYAANLVMALRGRYERLRNREDLDEAIATGREVAKAESARERRRGALLSQLSCALRVRYDHFGDATDLENALKISREAVRVVPAGYVGDRVACLGELSAVLRSRYERTQCTDDLDEAIETLEHVLTITQSGDRPYVRVVHLTTLCSLLVQRHRATGRWTDLDRALAVGRQAVRRMHADHRLYNVCLNNLALVLRVRCEHTPNAAELEEAVELARAAVNNAPGDDPARAYNQLSLALALHGRYRAAGRPADLTDALTLARDATSSPVADIPARVAAGIAGGGIAATAGEYAEAAEALEMVIELLPRLAARELRRSDQEHRLGQGSGIAASAAACALAAGQPEKAVRLLEQGRGVLLARALDTRADLTALRHHHPRLAEEFEELRDVLDAVHVPEPLMDAGQEDGEEPIGTVPASDDGAVRGGETDRNTRLALASRWDSLLERIRDQPGFAAFARGPELAALQATAEAGPIVFLNVSTYRSDAIILESGGVRTIRLPAVTPQAVAEQVRKTTDAVRREHLLDLGRQECFGEVLAWLWDAVAEPVVRALDLHRPQPGEAPPRVWWVPTGPLTLLPVHAAGHHDTRDHPDPKTLLDRVVSSYVPTVRTLRAARAGRSSRTAPRPLVVALPETPDAPPLRGALAEAEAVRRLFTGARVLSGPEAVAERVLAELPHSPWVHFACHAVTNPDAPSQGRLILHDHQRRPFSVADISRLRLRNAELAYVSSCSTAQPGERLFDEGIHLASSFQLAGFRQVVATLWLLHDRVGVEFATQVYRHLTASGTSSGAPAAAAAVHQATLTARDRYPNFPALWAGHIHVGQ